MMINNLNVLAIFKYLYFLGVCILFSCSNSKDFNYQEVVKNQHALPVFYINADSLDLFDDSLGIYVKGIGLAENWQGIKANFFSKRKIPIELSYVIDGKLVLQQFAKMKVSGGGSRKQPQNPSIFLVKKGFLILSFSIYLSPITIVFVYVFLVKIGVKQTYVML